MKKSRSYFLLLVLFLLTGCYQSKRVSYTDVILKKEIQVKHTMPIIVLDPGHGNFDLGTHNEFCEEKTLALSTALYVKTELVKMGYRVVMTRARDDYVPLKKRAQIANDTKSQVLVSVHYNAAHNTAAHGIEVFYPKTAKQWKLKRSKMLAQSILRKMLSNTGAFSRGVKAGNFCVIRETNMPAVLVECGFITNAEECKKMIDPAYQKVLARSIAEGLDEYFQM
jgi:N-acetylmuramoyl-L-alanine amidase